MTFGKFSAGSWEGPPRTPGRARLANAHDVPGALYRGGILLCLHLTTDLDNGFHADSPFSFRHLRCETHREE